MIEVDVEVEAEAWLAALPDAEFSTIAAAERALGMAQKNGAVTVLLADDAEVRALNRQWRAKDQPTNVLSFPMMDRGALLALGSDGPEEMLGDLALALETCTREAADKHVAVETHAAHLIVHGLLHLAGHDHEVSDAAAEAMEALETKALALMGIADPYADAHPR